MNIFGNIFTLLNQLILYKNRDKTMLNKKLRRRIIEEGYKRKHGHYGSSMSCIDTVKFLYDKVLKDDDIFIMSKGHGAPALHVVLEEKGLNPPWTIHLEYNEKRGIKATGGSLGQGLSVALGRAYAKKLMGKPGKVYCLNGDGEMQEGMIWESLNMDRGLGIDNLVVMIDWNKYQAIDSVKKIMKEDDKTLKNKLKAFGYNVTKVNGHNNKSLEKLCYLPDKGFNAVILDTQKGKGIPVLERNPSFHVYYFHEHPEHMKEALEYLK